MAATNTADDVDRFLTARGHDVEDAGWEQNGAKRQCPECGGLAAAEALNCGVCGWSPANPY
jgi:ribosomal protein S27AE